jgi:hypothetical protein
MAYAPDAKTLAVAWGNGLFFLDVRTGRERRACKNLPFNPSSLCLSPGGKIFAVGIPDEDPSSGRSVADVTRYDGSGGCFGELTTDRCLRKFDSESREANGWATSPDAR